MSSATIESVYVGRHPIHLAEALPVRLGSPDVSAVFLQALFWADEQWKGLEIV